MKSYYSSLVHPKRIGLVEKENYKINIFLYKTKIFLILDNARLKSFPF
eukprot:gene1625-994_t